VLIQAEKIEALSEFINSAKVASLFGVTERRVYQLMESGQIDYIGRRLHRIYRECFRRYLEGHWPLLLSFVSARECYY